MMSYYNSIHLVRKVVKMQIQIHEKVHSNSQGERLTACLVQSFHQNLKVKTG